MKRMLHKILGVVFILVVLAGGLLPAQTAAADVETQMGYEDLISIFEDALTEAGYVYEEDDDYEYDTENRYESEYDRALRILNENLTRTGMSLNAEQRVYDFFGKFSRTELSEIENWIRVKEAEGGISIRVFVAEMSMSDEKYFLEECTDALCDGDYAKEDMTIMLLNLDKQDRGVCIQGYGLCETRVNDIRIEYILGDVIEWFSDDEYVYGMKLFATEAAYYARSADYSQYYKDNSFKGKMHRMPWAINLLGPAGIALMGILLMKGSGGGKMTANGLTYIQNGISGLTAKKDDYVRTSVSRSYSPMSSGSGGSRSGGGTSRGGRSHSGGSRRF